MAASADASKVHSRRQGTHVPVKNRAPTSQVLTAPSGIPARAGLFARRRWIASDPIAPASRHHDQEGDPPHREGMPTQAACDTQASSALIRARPRRIGLQDLDLRFPGGVREQHDQVDTIADELGLPNRHQGRGEREGVGRDIIDGRLDRLLQNRLVRTLGGRYRGQRFNDVRGGRAGRRQESQAKGYDNREGTNLRHAVLHWLIGFASLFMVSSSITLTISLVTVSFGARDSPPQISGKNVKGASSSCTFLRESAWSMSGCASPASDRYKDPGQRRP